MPTVGAPRSFHKKFKFIVQVDNFGSFGFQKCSELSMEIAKVEYYEGGSLIPNKSPGRVTFSDVTLDRGATKDRDMYNWARQTTNVAANTGVVDDQYKRQIDIVQQDRDGKTLRRWRLKNAWPVKFNAGDWDNEADENVIEQITLTYDSFELIQA